MLVRDFECRSFEDAKLLLGSSVTKKVCNNTTLEWLPSGDYIGLRLHGHRIVTFFKGGGVSLYACGFKTVTIKDRINRCLPRPWRLSQAEKAWVVWNKEKEENIGFRDGMTVHPT